MRTASVQAHAQDEHKSFLEDKHISTSRDRGSADYTDDFSAANGASHDISNNTQLNQPQTAFQRREVASSDNSMRQNDSNEKPKTSNAAREHHMIISDK